MLVKLRFVCACLYILLEYQVHGSYIYFYRDKKWTDLYYANNIHTGCNHFPHPNTLIRGFKTDTCVILYKDELGTNCNATKADISKSRTKKIYPGLTISPFGNITGYRFCEGYGELIIDIVKPMGQYASRIYDMYSSGQTEFAVQKRHQVVCTCVNIFESVGQLGLWAIRNHDHEYVAYFEPDCTQMQLQSKLVSARTTWFSSRAFIEKDEAMYTPYPIKSIGPSSNTTYFETICNTTHKILDLQKKTNQLGQKLFQSERFFNESQIKMIAILQKQNVEIRKLEEKYNETEAKLEEKYNKTEAKLEEKYNETEAKLESFQNSIVDKLTELRNELDDSLDHFRDD